MAIQTKALTPWGIQVDVDLRSNEHDQEIKSLFEEHGLLVFRGQQLSAERQKELLGVLGPVLEDYTSIGYVSNTRPGGILGDAEVSSHSDFMYKPLPFLAVSLHAVEVQGGQTWTSFANGAGALEALPKELRASITGLEGLNLFSATAESLSGRQRLADYPEDAPRAVHPLVRRDPITGKQVLYVSEQNTALIVGMEEDASEALLAELRSYLYDPANIYEHRWYNGDLVIWANQMCTHARGGIVAGQTRTLQRVCLAEGPPEMYRAPFPAERFEVSAAA
jgi:taurine dioxygenase